jgi:hypothetical protein
MIRPVAKASWELLLALEHEEGVAGVYRDRANGLHWLSGNEDGGSGKNERRQRANAWGQVFAEARFPVYGLAGWEGERSWRGHGTSLGRVHQVTLAFGARPDALVETCLARAAEGHERRLKRALEQLLTPSPSEEAWQRLSPAALTVLLEQDQLRAGERIAAVVAQELTIPVDGRPRRFLSGRYGERWAAVTTPADEELTVTITADRIAPETVALERVRDIEPYLEAPPG